MNIFVFFEFFALIFETRKKKKVLRVSLLILEKK